MLTERLDLRTGDTPWDDDAWTMPAPDALPTSRLDLAVIGGGINGAILAEGLSAEATSRGRENRSKIGSFSTLRSLSSPDRSDPDAVGGHPINRMAHPFCKSAR